MDDLTIKVITCSIVSIILMIFYTFFTSKVKKLYTILHLNDDYNDIKKRRKTNFEIGLNFILLDILICLNIFSFKVLILLVLYFIFVMLLTILKKDEISSSIKIYLLLKDNIFKKNDYVKIGNIEGKIVNITKNHIVIENVKNYVETIRNCDIKNVINYSKNPIVSYVDVIIETNKYDANITNILQEGLIRLNEHYTDILEGPNVLGIEFLSKDITIRISVKTKYENKNTIERVIRKEVKRILDNDSKK